MAFSSFTKIRDNGGARAVSGRRPFSGGAGRLAAAVLVCLCLSLPGRFGISRDARAGPPGLVIEDMHGVPLGGRVVHVDDFETDTDRDGTPDGWWRRRGRLAWDAEAAHGGRHSVRIDGAGDWGRSYGAGKHRLFDLSREHYFAAWVRAEGVRPGSVYVHVYYWDAKTKRAAGPSADSVRIGSTNGWTRLAVRIPALPSARDSVWCGVSLVSTSDTGRVWFDDLAVIRPAPDPVAPESRKSPASGPVRVQEVLFHGKKAVRLDNGTVRVTIVPSEGGRIAEFALETAQRNVFRPETGYEEWLHCDGRRRRPDLSRVRFTARPEVRTGGAAVELTGRAGPFEVTRTISLAGAGSALTIRTRLVNRDDRPHRLSVQTHPEVCLAERTDRTLARVSREQGPPLCLQASTWVRRPGKWAALYDRSNDLFLAWSWPERPAAVHVYWNDYFCNIEEVTPVRLVRPRGEYRFSVVCFLGRGCDPLCVSDSSALGLRTVTPVGEGRLRVEARLFALQAAPVRMTAVVWDRIAGSLSFQTWPMGLHRALFEVALPAGAESARGVAVGVRAQQGARRLKASRLVSLPNLRLAAALKGAAWQDWGAIRNLGYWYWFGRLRFFGGPDLKTLEDGYRVRVRDGGDRFGVGFRWPKPLEPGFVYRFDLPFQGVPDFIAVDGRIVWRLGEGELVGPGTARFTVVPSRPGPGMIWCVRDISRGMHGAKDPIGLPAALRKRFVARCVRVKPPGPLPQIRYDSWPEPKQAWKAPCVQSDFTDLYKTPAAFALPPIRLPSYPTDEVRVGAILGGLWRRPDIYDLLCGHGVDGAWITERKTAGRPLPAETAAAIRRQVRRGRWHWFGSWISSQERWHRRPDWREQLFSAGIRQANYVTETFPELTFYFMIPETQSVWFGQEQPANDFERMARIPGILRAWKERKIWPLLTHGERCRAIYNTDHALFPAAYYYRGGADLAMVKNIHRQNVEIVGANARGAGRAYSRPFALHYDTWNGIYRDSASPAELLHVLRMYYFYDADFIDHEGTAFFVETEQGVRPTAPGVSLLRAARFIRRHPTRGTPVIRIAVMRGFGSGAHPYARDEIACASTGGGWSRPRPGVAEMEDFNLLRVFLPDYGQYWRTSLERFCTGTPYGQFDLIPWDTPAAHLRTFDLVVMMGRHGMDRTQWQRLETFVRQGGVLVAALGQFLAPGSEPRRFVSADLARFPGVVVTDRPGRSAARNGQAQVWFEFEGERLTGEVRRYYLVKPASGNETRVLARTRNNSPVLLRVMHGKGTVYLFCTPYLTSVSESIGEHLLHRLAAPFRLLEFDPPSDWLEYVVHRKRRVYSLALFNHGRLRFPAGNGVDHGVWKGDVVLFTERLRCLGTGPLEAWRVDPETFALQPLPVRREGQRLRVPLAIDTFAEVVIAPAGAKRDFFQ